MASTLSVPWELYSEEEIQEIISTVFRNMGCHVFNQHKAGRSFEGGADLIINKPGAESIAIAVKKKPNKNDLNQLLELSERSEGRKMYVYTSTPTPPFIDNMERRGKGVEFWSKEKLNEYVLEHAEYFFTNLLISNHELISTLSELRFILLELRGSCESIREKPTPEALSSLSKSGLWHIKDRTVFLHKGFRQLQYLFENLSNAELDKKAHVASLQSYLNLLTKYSEDAHFLIPLISSFIKDNKKLVQLASMKTYSRSHWGYLCTALGGVQPGFVKKTLDKEVESREHFKDLVGSKSEEIIKDTILMAIANHCRNMGTFTSALEEFADDWYTEAELGGMGIDDTNKR